MDITLTIDGLSLSKRLSTYAVTDEVEYSQIITTLDGVEHPFGGSLRPIVNFTLLPGTEEEDTALYEKLRNLVVPVTYTHLGKDYTKKMRLVSNLESAFLLTSADGKRRYKSGTIQLRRL